jgi:predicted aspartyl protease
MIGQVALAKIEWLDEEREVEVVISDGYDALIGTELLIGTMLNINYITRVVTISNASPAE